MLDKTVFALENMYKYETKVWCQYAWFSQQNAPDVNKLAFSISCRDSAIWLLNWQLSYEMFQEMFDIMITMSILMSMSI